MPQPIQKSHEAREDRRKLFFEEAYQTFLAAEKTSGEHIRHFYSIAGLPVCFHFAGPAMVRHIVPALEHLAIPPPGDDSCLNVCVWDNHSTDTRMPPPPWTFDDYTNRGEILGGDTGNILAACHINSTILEMLDPSRRLALFWTWDSSHTPSYVSGKPAHAMISWWMRLHGRQMVHAGAVGTREGCVLLTGKGGSGKSSTAISCLDSELFYLSDDYSIISSGQRDPVVHSLFNTGKIYPEDIPEYPFLPPSLADPDRQDDQKVLFFAHRLFPDKVLRRSPLKAVLIPRVTSRDETTFEKTSSAAALLALCPSTTSQLPYAGNEVIQAASAIVRSAPAYYLNLGFDRTRIPRVISELLQEESRESNE